MGTDSEGGLVLLVTVDAKNLPVRAVVADLTAHGERTVERVAWRQRQVDEARVVGGDQRPRTLRILEIFEARADRYGVDLEHWLHADTEPGSVSTCFQHRIHDIARRFFVPHVGLKVDGDHV